MNENEQKIIENIPNEFNKYFVPLAWAASLIARARKENRIQDDYAVKTLIDVSLLRTFRMSLLFA